MKATNKGAQLKNHPVYALSDRRRSLLRDDKFLRNYLRDTYWNYTATREQRQASNSNGLFAGFRLVRDKLHTYHGHSFRSSYIIIK